jgi:hypothetical protein
MPSQEEHLVGDTLIPAMPVPPTPPEIVTVRFSDSSREFIQGDIAPVTVEPVTPVPEPAMDTPMIPVKVGEISVRDTPEIIKCTMLGKIKAIP